MSGNEYQCLKSCFIIIWQLLPPLSSQPRFHKWAGSTTGWVLMWNGDSGADTWWPSMEPMSQIMFYNHLTTFGTIVKSAKGPQVGRFHNGMGPDVERDSGADTWWPAMEPMSQIMFYNHLATFATIVKSAKGPQVGRFHGNFCHHCQVSQGSTSGPVPQRDGPDVELAQWCGHLVSGNETNVSNHVL